MEAETAAAAACQRQVEADQARAQADAAKQSEMPAAEQADLNKRAEGVRGSTRQGPMARPKGSSRPFAVNGPTECRSRTRRNATNGCRATCRSITVSGSTQPSVAGHLSSDSMSCSADQRGETRQLATSLGRTSRLS